MRKRGRDRSPVERSCRPARFCIEFDNANARQDIEVLFSRANYEIEREIGCNLFATPAEVS